MRDRLLNAALETISYCDYVIIFQVRLKYAAGLKVSPLW